MRDDEIYLEMLASTARVGVGGDEFSDWVYLDVSSVYNCLYFTFEEAEKLYDRLGSILGKEKTPGA